MNKEGEKLYSKWEKIYEAELEELRTAVGCVRKENAK